MRARGRCPLDSRSGFRPDNPPEGAALWTPAKGLRPSRHPGGYSGTGRFLGWGHGAHRARRDAEPAAKTVNFSRQEAPKESRGRSESPLVAAAGAKSPRWSARPTPENPSMTHAESCGAQAPLPSLTRRPPRGVISAAPLQCARKVLGYEGSGAATPHAQIGRHGGLWVLFAQSKSTCRDRFYPT